MKDSWKRYSMFIAERASETMRERKITQAALAAKLGRTQQYVSHILSGRENLTLETIAMLGEALESNLIKGVLLGGSGKYAQGGLLRDGRAEIQYGSLRSSLPVLVSSSPIIRRFSSGERPFLITCEDSKRYLCKAAVFGGGATNLARELIGTSFANIWGLSDMSLAVVKVLPEHLDGDEYHYDYAVSCLGREWVEESVEIRDNHLSHIEFSEGVVTTLLKIALFDIWLSNEDRLNNNLNLLYSTERTASTGRIIAMDHAGIFNGSFATPLLQLSLTDSVVYSNLFAEAMRSGAPGAVGTFQDKIAEVEAVFAGVLEKCEAAIPQVWSGIPSDWNIDRNKYERLMEYIFSPKWTESCINNFKILLNKVSE